MCHNSPADKSSCISGIHNVFAINKHYDYWCRARAGEEPRIDALGVLSMYYILCKYVHSPHLPWYRPILPAMTDCSRADISSFALNRLLPSFWPGIGARWTQKSTPFLTFLTSIETAPSPKTSWPSCSSLCVTDYSSFCECSACIQLHEWCVRACLLYVCGCIWPL